MPTQRERTHEGVVRHVEERLAAGTLRTGDRLPAERALAEQLGVSRPSVREGIRVLEAMGVVRTAVGSGADAGAVLVADTASGLTTLLRLHVAGSVLPVADIVQARVLLESWAVREAARRRRTGGRVAELLDAMDAPGLDPDHFHRLDADFHVALAQGADNEVVSLIMRSLRDSIHDYVVAAVPGLPDWPAMARRLRREHRAVVRAVAAGDPDLAARRLGAHINGFYGAAFTSDRHDSRRQPDPHGV